MFGAHAGYHVTGNFDKPPCAIALANQASHCQRLPGKLESRAGHVCRGQTSCLPPTSRCTGFGHRRATDVCCLLPGAEEGEVHEGATRRGKGPQPERREREEKEEELWMQGVTDANNEDRTQEPYREAQVPNTPLARGRDLVCTTPAQQCKRELSPGCFQQLRGRLLHC